MRSAKLQRCEHQVKMRGKEISFDHHTKARPHKAVVYWGEFAGANKARHKPWSCDD
jgi:hypothetical protein